MKRLFLCLLLVACAEDEETVSNLADWECKQNLTNELHPIVDKTKESIEELCNNYKFRVYLSNL